MSTPFCKFHVGRFWFVLLAIISVLLAQSVLSGQHAKFLPSETVAAISVKRSPQIANSWKQTGLYHLCNHDSLTRFFSDLRDKSLKQKNSAALISNLNLGEMWNLVAGNVTFALIERNQSSQGLMIADIGPNKVDTIQWLESLEKSIASGGASKQTNGSTGISVVSYKLKTSEEKSFEGFSYAIKDNLLVIATSDAEVRNAFGRIDGAPAKGLLSQDPSFTNSTLKVQSENSQASLWWFVRPIELGKLAASKYSSGNYKHPSFFDLASQEGYDAVKSAGGVGRLNSDGSIAVVANVIAKRPFKCSMQLLDFNNENELTPPKWVSEDFSNSASCAVKFDEILKCFASLFDQLYGEGEEGVFDSVLDDIHNDPKGPKVDLQNEIFLKLDGALTMATLRKHGAQSVKVFAAPVKDSKTVSRAIDRLYKGDSQAEKIDDPSMEAWLVKPLENDPAAGQDRKTYVIAIREGFVLLAPSVADIKYCFENKSDSISGVPTYREFNEFAKKELGDSKCFSFFSRFDHLAERKLTEIKAGQPTGVVGMAFDKLGWSNVLQEMDRSSFPAFNQLQQFCSGNLGMAGKATDSGWRVVIELTSRREKK